MSVMFIFYVEFLLIYLLRYVFFFFQAEDGIRDGTVTGVQTCALPIFGLRPSSVALADLNDDGNLDVITSDVTDSATPSPVGGVSVALGNGDGTFLRSEERRVGKECRSRWSTDH